MSLCRGVSACYRACHQACSTHRQTAPVLACRHRCRACHSCLLEMPKQKHQKIFMSHSMRSQGPCLIARQLLSRQDSCDRTRPGRAGTLSPRGFLDHELLCWRQPARHLLSHAFGPQDRQQHFWRL